MPHTDTLVASFRKELDGILNYWEKNTVDNIHGGFFGRLDENDLVVEDAMKGAVLNARILWSWSAAYNLTQEARCLEMADRAFRYITQYFIDDVHGGVYWSVTAAGQALDTKKQIYALAFVIYGMSEYYRAGGDAAALDTARGLYTLIERYSHDAVHGGYIEALTRDWRALADLRLSAKDANEKKTMNTHLHILEAYTALYRIWKDEGLAGKIRDLIQLFRDHIVDPVTGHLGLFFGEQWQLRSDIVSFGHDIEASWLLTEAAEVLGDEGLLQEVRQLAVRIARASAGGLREDGSMNYEMEHGRLIGERHWWVQAEAVVGFLNAWQLTKEESFYARFRAVWDYTVREIVDHKKGEWFWGRRDDGSLMPGEDKAGSWKCPYHNSRACIEAIRRLGVTILMMLGLLRGAMAQTTIYVNQVGFDSRGPKTAVVQRDNAHKMREGFRVLDESTGKTVYKGWMGPGRRIADWAPGKWYQEVDFSALSKQGRYRLEVGSLRSSSFVIGDSEPVRSMISAIIHYYNRQRANTPEELAADSALQLFGSGTKVDMRGGWCDASGDVSKYFSHLAYANFMSPQQIPLVTWSMISTDERIPGSLQRWGLRDSLESEALWGADYMMRALSKDDYFRMIVFSYFNKDPHARRVVGLHANSVTTDEYQCAFREGGGMAIAALARIAGWKKNGDFTSAEYLSAAERAYAHLVVNNTRYDDDGKENIIDDYCALMAATELWIATDSAYYQEQARKRAENLAGRMTRGGYFVADHAYRPFWHASDAGLPVVALARYADKERNPLLRQLALLTIKKALDYELEVTGEVENPFGYPRQTFIYKDSVRNGFFIPHENETGWWWQGENARLGSLATAALVGGRLVAQMGQPAGGPAGEGVREGSGWGVDTALGLFASRQISWILGCNPYSICFMYGFGVKNVPYMSSNYGHGSGRGGISNGITGRDGNGDGSGIDFKTSAEGNEWRWTEQWIPHAAWFLQALSAIATDSPAGAVAGGGAGAEDEAAVRRADAGAGIGQRRGEAGAGEGTDETAVRRAGIGRAGRAAGPMPGGMIDAGSAAAEGRDDTDMKMRVGTIYDAIQRNFYDSSKALYRETSDSAANERPWSYLWPLCALIQAGNEMEVLEPGRPYMRPMMRSIDQYYSIKKNVGGYDSYVVGGGGGDRFFDDNQWIGLAYMDAFHRTHEKKYLQLSEEIYRFMMTGYDTVAGGGLYWKEGDMSSKNTCSNGPAVLLALRLYRATKQRTYLDTALMIYRWTQTHLLAPEGVYYDAIRTGTGRIDSARYTYNTGTMLQAAAILYGITHEQAYLTEAQRLAACSLRVFFVNGRFPEGPWFNAVLVRGYAELFSIDKDSKYMDAVAADARRIWDTEKDARQLIGKGQTKKMLDQAGFLEICARLAEARLR